MTNDRSALEDWFRRADELTKEKQLYIGLSGYAGSGKDTVAQTLVDEYGYTRVAFSDAVRDALDALNPYVLSPSPYGHELHSVQTVVDYIGWDSAKSGYSDIRRLLQRMGTEVGREIFGENIWVDIAMRRVEKINGPVVFTDVRFPNEYRAIAEMGGALWHVERPGVGPVNKHGSETDLDAEQFDVRIYNGNSLEDLADCVRAIMMPS